MTSRTASAHRQYNLHREAYLQFDSKKHTLTGKEHRRNKRQRHLYKKVAFRVTFHPCAIPSPDELAAYKQDVDNLRLKGIVTRVDGNSLVIQTPLRCAAGKQHMRQSKIWLYNQLDRVFNPSTDECSTKSPGHRAIRHGRQHNPRQIGNPVPDVVAPKIAALAATLCDSVLDTCASHYGLSDDKIKAELNSGLLTAAAG